ncbi:hypothetical protein A4X09_0g4753 [Tilletia walkeri]|uniref:Uncharacterized protein n=1 Tax=Tilletia walkeri TaxID=117179 RepID=A0A8X7N741_9BASI|nr:hypothetical protein A4X09_0g4753 [Tilletia walkeri]
MSSYRKPSSSWPATWASALSIVTASALVAAGTLNLLKSQSYTPTVISIVTFVAQACIVLDTVLFCLSSRRNDRVQQRLFFNGGVGLSLALILLVPRFETTQERIILILCIVAGASSLLMLGAGACLLASGRHRHRHHAEDEAEEGERQQLDEDVSPRSMYTDLKASPTLTNHSVTQWLPKEPTAGGAQSQFSSHQLSDSRLFEPDPPAAQNEIEIEGLLSDPPHTSSTVRNPSPLDMAFPTNSNALGLSCQTPYNNRSKGSAPFLSSADRTGYNTDDFRPMVHPNTNAFTASTPDLGSASLLYNSNDAYTAPSSPRSFTTAPALPSRPASRGDNITATIPPSQQRTAARLVRTPTTFRTNFHHPLDVEPVTATTPEGVDDETNGLTPEQGLALGRTLPNGSQERLALEAKATATFGGNLTSPSIPSPPGSRRVSTSSNGQRMITSPTLPGSWQPWISSPLAAPSRSSSSGDDASRRPSSSSHRTTPQSEPATRRWAVNTSGSTPSPTFRFLSEWTKKGFAPLMPASSNLNAGSSETTKYGEGGDPSRSAAKVKPGPRAATADSTLTFFPAETRHGSQVFATPSRPTTGNSTVGSTSGSQASPRMVCVAGVALSMDDEDEDGDEDEDEDNDEDGAGDGLNESDALQGPGRKSTD